MHPNGPNSRGGKRPGAGRKPSTLKGIAKRLPADTAALILAEINANQKWITLADSKDERVVLETLKYLTNRAHGMPQQAVAVSGELDMREVVRQARERVLNRKI